MLWESRTLLLLGTVGAVSAACAYVVSAQIDERREPAHEGSLTTRVGAELERRIPLLVTLRERGERQHRAQEGLRCLPEMLDILTLGLSAGLSFDASLELYCERSSTGLSQAFRAALDSWRMGINTRDEALRKLSDDLDLAALRRFSDAVSQALAFGSPLASVLEQQAQAIRDEQRSQVEEEIEKVPVKMLLPLGTLIVPAMLLAILGPLLGGSLALG
jgi:tight adherence protein C